MIAYKGEKVTSEELISARDSRFHLLDPRMKGDLTIFEIEHDVYGNNCCFAEADRFVNEDNGKEELYVRNILTAWGVRNRGLAKAIIARILEYAEENKIKKVSFRGFVFDLEAQFGGLDPKGYKTLIENFTYEGEIVYDLTKPIT